MSRQSEKCRDESVRVLKHEIKITKSFNRGGQNE